MLLVSESCRYAFVKRGHEVIGGQCFGEDMKLSTKTESYRAVCGRFSCALALVAVAVCCKAQAQGGGEEAVPIRSADTTVVMLASKNQEAAFTEVAEALRAQFADAKTRLVVRWIDAMPAGVPDQEKIAAGVSVETGAVAVFWYDLAAADNVYFYLASSDTSRVLVRKMEDMGEGGRADALAIITRTAVDGILQGGVIGVARPAAPPAPRPVEGAPTPVVPVPEKTDGPRRRLSADAAYTVSILSTELGAAHGVNLSVRLRLVDWFGAFFGYSVFYPFTARAPGVELEVARHPFHLGVYGMSRDSRWSLGWGANLTVDAAKLSPRSLSADISVVAPFWEVKLSAELVLRAEVRLVDALSLFVAAGAEAIFEHVEYRITDGPDLMRDMWHVQPRFWLGAVFHIR